MHHHAHIARKIKGFTLIELMIVMAIVALLMAMVGPLAIKNVEKAKIQEEKLVLVNWIQAHAYKSFATGKKGYFALSGKELSFHIESIFVMEPDKNLAKGTPDINRPANITSHEEVYSKSFEFLFFQPQRFSVNTFGMLDASSISVSVNGRESVVMLNGELDEK